MTERQKLEKAVELLRKSSEMYDEADRLLRDIGVETITSKRPIEFHLGNPRKKMFFIYSGVDEIADIIESPVIRKGHPYHDEIDENFASINVDGIEIFELRG